MLLTIHWRECAIERGRSKQPVRCAHWAEYGFSPMELTCWRSGSYGHYRGRSVAVPVVVPFGSKIIRRGEVDRLVVHWDSFGIGAETVAWLAVRGQRGFGIPEEAYVAKRRSDPMERGLFGKDDAPATSMIPGAHFKKDAPAASAELISAIQRAIGFMEHEQFETAKHVLIGAIEP
jgi:hypothetical protein